MQIQIFLFIFMGVGVDSNPTSENRSSIVSSKKTGTSTGSLSDHLQHGGKPRCKTSPNRSHSCPIREIRGLFRLAACVRRFGDGTPDLRLLATRYSMLTTFVAASR